LKRPIKKVLIKPKKPICEDTTEDYKLTFVFILYFNNKEDE
jgi:hypothetical protein